MMDNLSVPIVKVQIVILRISSALPVRFVWLMLVISKRFLNWFSSFSKLVNYIEYITTSRTELYVESYYNIRSSARLYMSSTWTPLVFEALPTLFNLKKEHKTKIIPILWSIKSLPSLAITKFRLSQLSYFQ